MPNTLGNKVGDRKALVLVGPGHSDLSVEQ